MTPLRRSLRSRASHVADNDARRAVDPRAESAEGRGSADGGAGRELAVGWALALAFKIDEEALANVALLPRLGLVARTASASAVSVVDPGHESVDADDG